MAVAVKTSPGPKSSRAPSSPALMSLAGVAYVVVCLALLFKGIPTLFWMGWEALGLETYVVQGGALLLTLSFVLGGVALYVGAQLSGEEAPVGVRAGTFVGLCGLLLVLLLTRWASVWIEHWAYTGSFSPLYGMAITAGFGVALLLIFLRLFFTRGAQDALVSFEEAGWFTATAFKGNQGQLVRRGTIFGILLLAGAGIYTLLVNNTLRRYGPDLALDIPFTGKEVIESNGSPMPQEHNGKLPLSIGERQMKENLGPADIVGLEVRYRGATRLYPGQQATLEAYRGAVKALLANEEKEFGAESRQRIEKALDSSPVEMVAELNRVINEAVQGVLNRRAFSADTVRRIEELDWETPLADKTRVVEFLKREATSAKTKVKLPAELDLPVGVLLVDQFAMKKVDAVYHPPAEDKPQETEKTVVVTFLPATAKVQFKENDIILEREYRELKKTYPTLQARDASPPAGPVRHASLVLLPAIQYTVPLLLILVALWFAWRAVNLPVFADFLIATEAELNKVSWTTQKRLIQDTAVVLVTVFLMAVFLFLVDWGWKSLLQHVFRVLYIPPDAPQQQIEKKKY